MPRIFERKQAERTVSLVRMVLRDLHERRLALREALKARQDGEPHAPQRLAELRCDVQRYVDELEAVGCCVSYRLEQPVALFPAVKGHRLGFFKLRVGADRLEAWTPAQTAPVERGSRSAFSARHGTP